MDRPENEKKRVSESHTTKPHGSTEGREKKMGRSTVHVIVLQATLEKPVNEPAYSYPKHVPVAKPHLPSPSDILSLAKRKSHHLNHAAKRW